MIPSSDPLIHFKPDIVQSLSVTADGNPLPDEIAADAELTILVLFLKPTLPPDREYQGFFLLRNSGSLYPDPPQMPMILTRVREVGEPRESLTVKKKGAMVDVTPPLRPANDPECHYVAHLNVASLPKGIVSTKPIDLHLWLYERETRKLASGQRDGSPKPSVLIYKTTFQIVDSDIAD